MRRRNTCALLTLGLITAACGYKGPLTLPEEPGPVIIRPAPAAPAEQPAETATAPAAQPAEPATEEPSPKPPAPKDPTAGD